MQPAKPVALNHTTDTLHLLNPPELSLVQANHTILVPKGAAYQAQTFLWNTTLHHSGNVSAADFHLFFRLTGSQAQAGAQDPGCSVVATLVFTHNGTARGVSGGCGSLGLGVVPPGDRELSFAAPPDAFATPATVHPGDDVQVQLTVYLESPGFATTCYILAGPDHDSRMVLAGLNETLPAILV